MSQLDGLFQCNLSDAFPLFRHVSILKKSPSVRPLAGHSYPLCSRRRVFIYSAARTNLSKMQAGFRSKLKEWQKWTETNCIVCVPCHASQLGLGARYPTTISLVERKLEWWETLLLFFEFSTLLRMDTELGSSVDSGRIWARFFVLEFSLFSTSGHASYLL